jgi:hypothetical protein
VLFRQQVDMILDSEWMEINAAHANANATGNEPHDHADASKKTPASPSAEKTAERTPPRRNL